MMFRIQPQSQLLWCLEYSSFTRNEMSCIVEHGGWQTSQNVQRILWEEGISNIFLLEDWNRVTDRGPWNKAADHDHIHEVIDHIQ